MAQINFSVEQSGTVTTEATGHFRTDGARIVDSDGTPVQIVGANWFGAEGANKIPNGLWARNYKDMIDQMVDSGINTIRLPISPAVLDDEPVSGGLYEALNPTLAGRTPIEVIDAIIDYAGESGLRVFLDMHRIDAGTGKQESGLWFSEDYPIEDLAADWQEIAGRYAGNPTVMGVDVFNEPSGPAHWGEDGAPEHDWAAAAEYLGNAILEANPDVLVMVQGVHIVDGDWYWVGGNLSAAGERPITLDVDDRLVYSPHDYPASVRDVPWLQGATAEDMRALFQEHWGYLAEQGIAPILVGETGGRLDHEDDALYLDTLFAYLEELGGGSGVTWWGWNPNSEDTGGLLDDDWQEVDPRKLAYLESLEAGMLPASAHGDVVVETLTADFGTEKGHDRIFRLDIAARDEAGELLWQDVRMLHIPTGETADSVRIHIPADVRADATHLDIDAFYVSGVRLGRFEQPLPGWAPASEGDSSIVEDETVTAEEMATIVQEMQALDGAGEGFLTWTAGALGGGGADFSGAAIDLSDAFEMRLEMRQGWGDTVMGRVHLTNTSGASLDDWSLAFEGYGLQITAVHKVSADFGPDGIVTVGAADWMKAIAAGDTLVFGFDARRVEGEGASDSDATANAEVDAGDASQVATLAWAGAGLGEGAVALATGSADGAISVRDLDVWGDRFLLRLELTNTSEAEIDDWALLFDGAGFAITGVNAAGGWHSDDGGDTARVEGADWNDGLDPGETVRLSLEGVLEDGWVFA